MRAERRMRSICEPPRGAGGGFPSCGGGVAELDHRPERREVAAERVGAAGQYFAVASGWQVARSASTRAGGRQESIPVVLELAEALVDRGACSPVGAGLVDPAERAGGWGLSHDRGLLRAQRMPLRGARPGDVGAVTA